MRIKSGFVQEKVGSKYLAVAVGERADEFHALVKMNATGAFLFSKLDEADRSEEELLSLLLAEYDVPENIAKRDISLFIESLRSAGMLDE